jgi:hypothetical protein
MKLTDNVLRTGSFVLFFTFIFFEVHGQKDQGRPLPHFLFPGFTKGVVIMKGGDSFSASLNYNMVDEKMVTELNGAYRYATRLQDIDTIFLEYRKFVPVEKAFYEVLVSGPAIFFLQNKSLYTPNGSPVGYGSKSQSVGPTKYRRYEMGSVVYQYNDVVYIDLPPNVTVTPASVSWVRKNNKMEKLTNEKQLLKIFPDKINELKDYFKKNKPDLKERDDLIKLGNYCNELYK